MAGATARVRRQRGWRLVLAVCLAVLALALSAPTPAQAAMTATQKEQLKQRLWDDWEGRGTCTDVSDLGIYGSASAYGEVNTYVRQSCVSAHPLFSVVKDAGYPQYQFDSSGLLCQVLMAWSPYTGTQATFDKYFGALDQARAQVDDSMDDLAKAVVLHDWLLQRVRYGGMTSGFGGTAYGAFVEGAVVCEGYAETYDLILREAGVESTFVSGPYWDENHDNGDGTTGAYINHAWNLVKIDGQWYHVDPTWDDSTAWEPDGRTPSDGLHHDYFLLNEQEMAQAHGVADRTDAAAWVAENGATATSGTRFSGAFWREADVASRAFAWAGGSFYYLRGTDVSNARVCYRAGAFGAEQVLCTLDVRGEGADPLVSSWIVPQDARVLTDGAYVYVNLPFSAEAYEVGNAQGPAFQVSFPSVAALCCTPKGGYLTGIYFEDGQLLGKGYLGGVYTRGLVSDTASSCVHARGLAYVPGEAATCYATGRTPCYRCNLCGSLFRDAQGTQATTTAALVLPKDPENHGVRAMALDETTCKEATCEQEGYTGDYVCLGCKAVRQKGTAIPKHPNLEGCETVPATCVATGLRAAGHCPDCGQDVDAQVLPIDPSNHAGTATQRVTCAPTCCSEGVLTSYLCDDCWAEKSHEALAQNQDHAGGKSVVGAVAATCSSAGWSGDTLCNGCGSVLRSGSVVAKTAHPSTKLVNVRAATATQPGYSGDRVCTVCGETVSTGAVLTATGTSGTSGTGSSSSQTQGGTQGGSQNQSGAQTQGSAAATKPAGSWRKDARGWWWRRADGSYPRGAWEKIAGTWYLFDGSGYMRTGWARVGASWYYLRSSGAMAEGWERVGGTWYYLTPGSGAMATGWNRVGGVWYLHAGSGAMLTGWQRSGGQWYYLRSSGAMASSCWVGHYYLTGSGAMATNCWVGRYHVNAQGRWDATR